MLEQKTQTKLREKRTETKTQDPERYVSLDNQLLKFGINHLSAPSLKILYLVIARYLNSDIGTEHPVEIDIPISEFRNVTVAITDEEQSSRIVEELQLPFKVPNGILINGQKYQGEMSWFTSITRVGAKKGLVRFRFNPITFEPILNPHAYTTFYRPEINRLKSVFALKIFQILRSIQNRRADWHSETRRKFDVNWLKDILGMPRFKKLNKQTIQKVIEEINRLTNLKVLEVINHPEAGDTKSLEFVFTIKPFNKSKNGLNGSSGGNGGGGGTSEDSDNPDGKEEKSPEKVKPLSWTQALAFDKLVDFGIKKEVALRQMIPSISRGKIIGFEDFFAEELLSYFQENTPINDANTFTKWWSYSEVFHPTGDVWKTGLEKLKAFKEELENEQPEALEKRLGIKSDGVKKKQTVLPNLNHSPTPKPTIS